MTILIIVGIIILAVAIVGLVDGIAEGAKKSTNPVADLLIIGFGLCLILLTVVLIGYIVFGRM